MNEYSSRSHSIFLVKVNKLNLQTRLNLQGKLYLIDLAGSEKISKSGAAGNVLDEAKMINKSLLAFGNVISALEDGNKRHIPYRDSKLTRVLQESLGGNSKTTIIICCSPASYNESETRSTLDFGKRAKTIKNVVSVNKKLTSEEWKRKYEKEKEKVAKFKTQLEKMGQELQRWRVGSSVSSDDTVQMDMDTSTTSLNQSVSFSCFDLSSIVDDDAIEWSKERENFSQQLNDKDTEIYLQLQLIEKLKEQMLAQDELMTSTRQDYEQLHSVINLLVSENKKAKKGFTGVLQVLKELAVNYDKKSEEVDRKTKENESISEELSQKQNLLDVKGKPEEEFTLARIYISKIKSEVKSLHQKCSNLKSFHGDTLHQIEEIEKHLAESRLLVSQHEAKMKSLSQSLKKEKSKNRALEEKFAALRDEITIKQILYDELKDENQILLFAQEHTKADYESLKAELSEKTTKLNELTAVMDRKEQARLELKGLQETVSMELQTLLNLRKLFTNDLQSRLK